VRRPDAHGASGAGLRRALLAAYAAAISADSADSSATKPALQRDGTNGATGSPTQ
jgi:hypothetical protein